MVPEFQKKTIIRAVAVLLLLVSFMGPWYFDIHWATEETCPDPFVWKGLAAFMEQAMVYYCQRHSE